MLADGLFHKSTIKVLLYYGKKEGYESFLQTAQLLGIFRQWFNVLNIKVDMMDRESAIHGEMQLTWKIGMKC